MKVKNYFLIIIMIFILFLSACTPKPEDPPVYGITKATGLYAEFNVDAEQLAVLSEGTRVQPANGASTLQCDSITEEGMVFNLCKVTVIGTTQTGWVLEKWLRRQN